MAVGLGATSDRKSLARRIAGLVFSVLFVAVLVLHVRLASGATAQEIADFYLERDIRETHMLE